MKKLKIRRKSGARYVKSSNRGNVVKLTTKMDAKIKRRNDAVFARKFVTIGVLVSSLMVGVSLFVSIYFNPERLGKQKFEEMAKTYYETYYYEKFMDSVDPEVFEEMFFVYEATAENHQLGLGLSRVWHCECHERAYQRPWR